MTDVDELISRLYDIDDTFQPLTSSYGNVNGELAHLRDTYMESEAEYFKALLTVDSIRTEFMKYINFGSDELFEHAINIQDKLEQGLLETSEEMKKMKLMTPEQRDYYHMCKLERAEGMMCLLFAAASDKVKVLQLVLTNEPVVRSRQ